jgi:hypothetical protein
MARKADEAAKFCFCAVNLAGAWSVYDKCHADCARWDKIDLDWERISHEMKEPGFRLSSFEAI